MRLMRYPTVGLLMFLIAGCDPVVLAPSDPLFCDVEEPRVFTRDELEVRAARWPQNLRRDWKTNTTWDRECKSEER